MTLLNLTRPRRPRQPGDLLAFLCLRDERPLLEHWLAHHRALGIDEFVIIDNDSHDGSREALAAQADVRLYHTDDSYAASHCGMDWIHQLLDEQGVGHWVLVLDADELFVFPGREHLGLAQLVACLDARQLDALGGFLLDMYSDRPLSRTELQPGQDWLDCCPFFDGEGYDFLEPGASLSPEHFRGGPRRRIFWDKRERQLPSPYLGKIPLVKWWRGRAYAASTHLIPSQHLAPETCVLLHFKFFSRFLQSVPREVRRKEHWNDASQYRAYLEVLEDHAELKLWHSGSVRFRDTGQLVERGFLHSSPELQALIASAQHSR